MSKSILPRNFKPCITIIVLRWSTSRRARAYSQGWMTIDVVDPTNLKELEAEAKRFGIEPIDYRFRDQNTTELRKVFMGAALVYGDKQEVLPIVTQIETLEYDIVRALLSLALSEAI